MTHENANGPLGDNQQAGGTGHGLNGDAIASDYNRTPSILSIPLIENCLDRIEADDATFNQAFSAACELAARQWPDVDALADLVIAEIQLSQPNPPGDAYFRFFSAWGRYWGIGEVER